MTSVVFVVGMSFNYKSLNSVVKYYKTSAANPAYRLYLPSRWRAVYGVWSHSCCLDTTPSHSLQRHRRWQDTATVRAKRPL